MYRKPVRWVLNIRHAYNTTSKEYEDYTNEKLRKWPQIDCSELSIGGLIF